MTLKTPPQNNFETPFLSHKSRSNLHPVQPQNEPTNPRNLSSLIDEWQVIFIGEIRGEPAAQSSHILTIARPTSLYTLLNVWLLVPAKNHHCYQVDEGAVFFRAQ